MGEKDKFEQYQDEEFKREFYSMNARLFGPNGNDGVLADIKETMKESLDNQKELKDQFNDLKIQVVEKIEKERSCRKEENTRIDTRIDKIEKDLDGVGTIARTIRDRNGKFWGKVRDAAIPLFVAAILILLLLGVQAYFNQGRRVNDPLGPQPIICVDPWSPMRVIKWRRV